MSISNVPDLNTYEYKLYNKMAVGMEVFVSVNLLEPRWSCTHDVVLT